jgi:PAS domain S-box-containing protein
MTPPPSIHARYHDLQRYVAWTDADRERIVGAVAIVAPHFAALIEDFYQEIQRHPAASSVITGGQSQVDRLKQTLLNWLRELFAGTYDEPYVARRWRVGLRHVELGLPQVYTVTALSRLRIGLIRVLRAHWTGDEATLALVLQSVNKLLDLDLAIIGDAYETEYVARQQAFERRRLGDILQQEQELSAGLLAHAQVAVLILDRQGQIVRSSAFFQHLGGWRADEVQDRDWFELCLEPEDRPRMRRELLEVATRDAPAAAGSVFCRDGNPRHLHWSAVPLQDATGQPFAILVIGHDITGLQEAQQRALQAERLAAIGQMATGLAHESRNALQRIGASAETLELELEGNPQALALVARIQQSQAHLHKLLDEVRNYAAPVTLDCSTCRLSEVWREAWELLLAQRQPRQAELRERLDVRDLTIDADRFRLVQVFRNLLENSLAACADPVLIDIHCKPVLLGESPGLCVRVRDNGPGLNAEQRRRIFEPFYTTKPTGTGLGMAIAQRIVDAHGGTISLGPEGAAGTEIVINLPACARG